MTMMAVDIPQPNNPARSIGWPHASRRRIIVANKKSPAECFEALGGVLWRSAYEEGGRMISFEPHTCQSRLREGPICRIKDFLGLRGLGLRIVDD